jgi:hypothetical protein
MFFINNHGDLKINEKPEADEKREWCLVIENGDRYSNFDGPEHIYGPFTEKQIDQLEETIKDLDHQYTRYTIMKLEPTIGIKKKRDDDGETFHEYYGFY